MNGHDRVKAAVEGVRQVLEVPVQDREIRQLVKFNIRANWDRLRVRILTRPKNPVLWVDVVDGHPPLCFQFAYDEGLR